MSVESSGDSDGGSTGMDGVEKGSSQEMVQPPRHNSMTLLRAMSPARSSTMSPLRACWSPLRSAFDSGDCLSPPMASSKPIHTPKMKPPVQPFSQCRVSPATALNASPVVLPVTTACRDGAHGGDLRSLRADSASSRDGVPIHFSDTPVEEMLHLLGTGPLARRGLMTVELAWPYLVTSSCGRMSALTALTSSQTCGGGIARLLGRTEDKDAACFAMSSLELLDASTALDFHALVGRPGHERSVKFLIGPRGEQNGAVSPRAAPRQIQVVALPLDVDPSSLTFAAVSRRRHATPLLAPTSACEQVDAVLAQRLGYASEAGLGARKQREVEVEFSEEEESMGEEVEVLR
ncbi:hypothetical protein T484DRAFT_1839603, partial [Baffinella frigidus]